jgi:hypothetical protein
VTSNSVWTLWRRGKSFTDGNRTWAVQPVNIPTEVSRSAPETGPTQTAYIIHTLRSDIPTAMSVTMILFRDVYLLTKIFVSIFRGGCLEDGSSRVIGNFDIYLKKSGFVNAYFLHFTYPLQNIISSNRTDVTHWKERLLARSLFSA